MPQETLKKSASKKDVEVEAPKEGSRGGWVCELLGHLVDKTNRRKHQSEPALDLKRSASFGFQFRWVDFSSTILFCENVDSLTFLVPR